MGRLSASILLHVNLSKADARRILVRHQFAHCATGEEAFERLRSIQFDPIAPAGCNHDLVLQARVPGYKVGEWETLAYEKRHIYDGWDKQASLIPFSGWPLRRLMHKEHRESFQRILVDHASAVETILREIEARGPLMPKECEFQERKEEWKGSWLGPNLVKQVLRALWHSGQVMTSGRRKGQHVYDLTERILPPELLNAPTLTDKESRTELVLERHRAMGFVRPAAPPEIWSYGVLMYTKKESINDLLARGDIVPVTIEGMATHATPQFLTLLDQPSNEPRVIFVAPLDQLMWDRKMIAQLFGFDYSWEIYTPEAKRRWGYYVLPILYGDNLVARVEFYCRAGILEVRQWHFESIEPQPNFFEDLQRAVRDFAAYCSAKKITVAPHIDRKIRDLLKKVI